MLYKNACHWSSECSLEDVLYFDALATGSWRTSPVSFWRGRLIFGLLPGFRPIPLHGIRFGRCGTRTGSSPSRPTSSFPCMFGRFAVASTVGSRVESHVKRMQLVAATCYRQHWLTLPEDLHGSVSYVCIAAASVLPTRDKNILCLVLLCRNYYGFRAALCVHLITFIYIAKSRVASGWCWPVLFNLG